MTTKQEVKDQWEKTWKGLLKVLIFLITKVLLIWGLWDNTMVVYFNVIDITLLDAFYMGIISSMLFNRITQSVELTSSNLNELARKLKGE